MDAKKAFLGLLLVGSSAVLLSSCEKNDVYDPSKADKKTEDLIVPEGFDWAMTRNVTISMQAEKPTFAFIYLNESCTDLVAELPVKAGMSNVTLEIPTEGSYVWIKYPTAEAGKEGVLKVSIQNSATRAAGEWTANALFPEYPEQVFFKGGISYYQPAKDRFGTIMFEDMWPKTGDYDFNDYVVNYNVKASAEESDQNHVFITMKLKIRAMGGSLPYRFCVQVGRRANGGTESLDILRKDVELVSNSIEVKNCSEGTVELLDAKYTIVALSGFDGLKKQDGAKYYNTEKDHLVGQGSCPEIVFTLKVRTDNQYNMMQSRFTTAFDYFLQRPDTKREIHLLDFPPTELYTDYDKDSGTQPYYSSEAKFVWALKAPREIGWAVESKDISTVYPEFSNWVSTGGNWLEPDTNWDSNRQWYNRPSADTGIYISPNQH